MKENRQNQIIFFFPDIKIGGVEKNFFIISNYLTKFFDDLNLITSSKINNQLNKEIKVHKINSIWLIFGRRITFLICSIKLIFRCLKKKNSTIVSFQGNFYALIVAIILNKKILIRSNVSPSSWSGNIFKFVIYKYLLSKANQIIVNSSDFKKEFKKVFNINAKVIFNPIKIEKPNKFTFKNKINFYKRNTLNLINVGRLEDQKNQIEILKALNYLNKKILKFRLLIIGSGKKKNYLTNYIKTNLMDKYVRIYSSSNAINFIKAADVFILSSKFEGLPNVLLEAASLNKYIISSDCKTGPKEIINSYRYGKLYKQGNILELASILGKLNKNKIIKNKKNYTKNLNKFNYDRNLKKYYEVVKKLI